MTVHDIDSQCLRRFRESRHPDDVTGDRYYHLCTGIDYNIFYIELETLWGAVKFRVLRERVLGFGDADRELR